MLNLCNKLYNEDYYTALVICLFILTLICVLIWSINSYRHEIATITSMHWERTRSIQQKKDVTNTRIDHKGNVSIHTSTVWRTVKNYHTRGGRHTLFVWPKTRSLRYRERIVSSQVLYIHMNGKTEGKLTYDTADYNTWNRYNIGQDVYLTLMWRKMVWEIKPYKMEAK